MAIFSSAMAVPVVAIVSIFSWMIIHCIVVSVKSIVKHRNEVELKQMLVERGMTADEIERVIMAKGTDDEAD